MSNAAKRLAWPSSLLLCVRNPVEHPALLLPYGDYPTTDRSGVLGPIRDERCDECGSLMYVAGARVAV